MNASLESVEDHFCRALMANSDHLGMVVNLRFVNFRYCICVLGVPYVVGLST